jgi:6-phosphogluconolactonase (cycloisomerase 2 family)
MRFHPIRTAAVVGAACALGVAGPAMAGDGHGKSEHAKHHAKSGKGKAHKGKTGYVYVATNDPAGNAVVVYRRAADGSLTEAGRYETGGAGGGGRTELPVPITDSQGPIALTRNGRLLFVVNPGSDTVTSFRANGAKLTRVAVVPSNGDVPTAVDAEHHVLYVTNDYTPNMTGYRYDSKGRLTPIAGSTVAFPEGREPGGVAIDPQG